MDTTPAPEVVSTVTTPPANDDQAPGQGAIEVTAADPKSEPQHPTEAPAGMRFTPNKHTELVLVFFRSKDKIRWEPVERDQIPEWLRDERIWDVLIAGNCVRNTLADAECGTGMWHWTATAVDRRAVQVESVLMPRRFAL